VPAAGLSFFVVLILVAKQPNYKKIGSAVHNERKNHMVEKKKDQVSHEITPIC